MNLQQQREIALRAARHQLRQMGCEMTVGDAEKVLDDMTFSHPDRIAARWFANASDNQWNLFKGEWRKHNEQE